MSDKKKSTKQAAPPLVTTLTLPEHDGIEHKGTLLIQRGDLAHVRQFTYLGVRTSLPPSRKHISRWRL